MTPAEAKTALQFHAFTHADFEDERATSGFLGSLRPYRGRLNEAGFHEVMQALRVLAPQLGADDRVDRLVLRDILAIVHYGRAWGLDPDGMLRSNGLISPDDVDTLDRWVHCMQYTITQILDGAPADVAFEAYRAYDEEARTP